jgi:hypothetical protein
MYLKINSSLSLSLSFYFVKYLFISLLIYEQNKYVNTQNIGLIVTVCFILIFVKKTVLNCNYGRGHNK